MPAVRCSSEATYGAVLPRSLPALSQFWKALHRVIGRIVAFAFGLAVAYGAYQWASDTERPARRMEEESVAVAANGILRSYITEENLEISDANNRVRAAGKDPVICI